MIKSHHTLNALLCIPCEICVQQIAMLTNCVNKLPRKTQTTMQDSSTENYSRKNTPLMMWALFILLKRRYLPSNPQNNRLYAAAATKKNASQQNPFAHHHRSVAADGVTVLVSKSKSVYTTLIIV